MSRPRIGLLLGDPGGVGPELCARLLHDPALVAEAKIVIIGHEAIYRRGEELAGVENEVEIVTSIDAVEWESPMPFLVQSVAAELSELPPARVSVAAGRYVLQCLDAAVSYARAGYLDGLCYASLNKQAMHEAGNPFQDELNYLADKLDVNGPFREFNIVENLWTARVSSHVPLREAAEHVTLAEVLTMIELSDQTLRRAGYTEPKLLVCGLNPHAGDGGLIGSEEIEVIRPAISKARDEGIHVDGPVPPDAAFPMALRDGYHLVVSMYHDQGQIALKMMSDDHGVTVHGGLPLPVTTPSHGTAFDIVGKGVARLDALRAAFVTCCRMAGIDKA